MSATPPELILGSAAEEFRQHWLLAAFTRVPDTDAWRLDPTAWAVHVVGCMACSVCTAGILSTMMGGDV